MATASFNAAIAPHSASSPERDTTMKPGKMKAMRKPNFWRMRSSCGARQRSRQVRKQGPSGQNAWMLGDALRKARREAWMSQEKVALQTGVDRRKNNRWPPTVDMLFRICDAMGIKASDILATVERSRTK